MSISRRGLLLGHRVHRRACPLYHLHPGLSLRTVYRSDRLTLYSIHHLLPAQFSRTSRATRSFYPPYHQDPSPCHLCTTRRSWRPHQIRLAYSHRPKGVSIASQVPSIQLSRATHRPTFMLKLRMGAYLILLSSVEVPPFQLVRPFVRPVRSVHPVRPCQVGA